MNQKISNITFIGIAILWGSSFSFQDHLLDLIDPFNYLLFTFGLSSIITLLIILYKKYNPLQHIRIGLTLGIFLFCMELTQTVGLSNSNPANAVFLTNIGMLLIPFLGFLLYKHKIKRSDFIALIVAVIGMYYLAGGVNGFGFGEFVLLLSALSMAFYFLHGEVFALKHKLNLFVLSAQTFVTTTVLTFIVMSIKGSNIILPQNVQAELIWQTLVFTICPYILIQWASKYTDDIRMAMYDGVIEPLSGGIVAWYIFNQVHNSENVMGACLMLVGFLIAVIGKRKKRRISQRST